MLKVVLDSVTPWTIARQTPVPGIFQARILEQVAISYFKLSSVAQSCLTLGDPMNRSTPDLPVHHQLQCPFSQ